MTGVVIVLLAVCAVYFAVKFFRLEREVRLEASRLRHPGSRRADGVTLAAAQDFGTVAEPDRLPPLPADCSVSDAVTKLQAEYVARRADGGTS